MTPSEQPVSERLAEMQNRAVLRGLKMPTPDYMIVAGDLIDALPELIALVKLSEETRVFLLEWPTNGAGYKNDEDAAEDMADMRKRIFQALTALERKLGDAP